MPMKTKKMPRRRFQRRRKFGLKKALTNMNQNSFSTACRWEAGIGIVPGEGSVSNYVYFSSSALQGVCAVKNTREFAVYSKLFDQFRITGVSLKFIPRASVQSVSEVNAQIVATPSIPSTQIAYSSWDQDSAIPSSVAAIQTMRSTRKHDMLKTWKRSFRYTYKDNSWLDTGLTYDVVPGVSNWVSKGLYGNFGFYGENLPFVPGDGAPIIGQVEIIYHVVFRGQRLVNVSETEDGLVTLGNPEPTMKPLSTLDVQTKLKDVADDNECDLVVPTK